jgi:hypothetical protein
VRARAGPERRCSRRTLGAGRGEEGSGRSRGGETTRKRSVKKTKLYAPAPVDNFEKLLSSIAKKARKSCFLGESRGKLLFGWLLTFSRSKSRFGSPTKLSLFRTADLYKSHDCASDPDGEQQRYEGLYWFRQNISTSSLSRLCSCTRFAVRITNGRERDRAPKSLVQCACAAASLKKISPLGLSFLL